MPDKAIITAASNKFFPSLINLISSIKLVYPDHPTIFVYDLGLLPVFRQELRLVDNLRLIEMPKFCGHWRSCYAWKTYIFSHPLARLNFYLDAGCQLLKSIEEVFSIIDKEGVLLIDQEQIFSSIVPRSYKSIFDLDDKFDNLTTVHAGIIGFKDDPKIISIFRKIYDSACAGLALGFSPKDKWRNRGKDKNIFIRDCLIFRHDMTLLNVFVRKYLNDGLVIRPLAVYHGERNFVPGQLIWQMRLNYKNLENLKIKFLHKEIRPLFLINRFIIMSVILVKNINIFIKNKISRYLGVF